MRLLAVAVLFGLAVPVVSAGDKDEDKAKEIAVAFLKAVKAKDIDALMKTVDVPFLMIDKAKPRIFEKAEELKADLKSKLEGLKDTDVLPTEVSEVLDRAALLKKAKGKDDELIKMFEK